MHIQHIEIGNFRKLRAVRVDLAPDKTVFVGANNSGKTSAMVALRRFLVDPSEFTVTDLTLSHWKAFNAAADSWEAALASQQALPAPNWNGILPFLDVWLRVERDELHYVQKILPTLDWDGELLGVRLRYEPKDVGALQREYLKAPAHNAATLAAAKAARLTAPVALDAETLPPPGELREPQSEAATTQPAEAPSSSQVTVSLWPQSMIEFLERRMRGLFAVRGYLLDPAKLTKPTDGIAAPQLLCEEDEAIDGEPLKGLISIDEISAHRELGQVRRSKTARDDETGVEDTEGSRGTRLSVQLKSYYSNHLNPHETPEPKDLVALEALEVAGKAFDSRLKTSFANALKELEDLGYPGVTDPKLTISAQLRPTDGLSHNAAVQYEVPTYAGSGASAHRLPENSNGLGYQNLVSMVFGLMSFRDAWMKVGKAGSSAKAEESFIPPLHLVLVEEPEAHLHAQVQQVFIKQAYAVLRNHPKLGTSVKLTTQLIVSTHSSHVAHACDFASLRYFRRLPAPAEPSSVPIASVVNLSEVFGDGDKTEKFVTRYLKASHCDLFFADGAVLVEGPAERVLIPHFVEERAEYEHLRRCYITWLEIGGSHAHRLRKLIEHLGITTLIITDIDAKAGTSSAAVPPERGQDQRARNETLKTWIPASESLDELLDKSHADKILLHTSGYAVRVAYQMPVQVLFKSAQAAEALANTFEDALLYQNISFFRDRDGTGLVAQFRDALAGASDLRALATKVHADLKAGGKAAFALDLLYSDDVRLLKVPAYIDEGLLWLIERLKRKEHDVTGAAAVAV